MKKLYNSLPLMAVAIMLLIANGLFSQTNPVAVDDTLVIKKHYTALINVLQNDYDPEGNEIVIIYINNSGSGYATQFMDSSLRYTNTLTSGWDSLKYTITRKNDWEAYATAWLHVDVLENEMPAFTIEPPTVMVGEVVEFNLHDVASDPDGDDFFIERVWDPEHGEEEGYNDSIFSFIITENFSGLDSCRIRFTDADFDLNFTTHFVFNVERNPEFPVAVCDTSIAFQGDTAYIPVLQNDFDPQNDAFRICDVELEMGNLKLEYNDSIVKIMPKIIADTGFRLAFTYQVEEIENPGHISHYAGGYLYIQENPNLPIAVNDTVSVMAGFPVDIPVLLNDTDINGDTLIVSYAYLEQNIGFTSHTDSIVSFTAYSNLSGMYSFTYAVREKHNEAHYCIGKIFVDIIENPIQPIAVNDTIQIQGLQTIEFNPLLNDFGLDNLAIQLDPDNQNTAFIYHQTVGDSSVNLTVLDNCRATIEIPYSFYQTDNPMMVSNEAKMVVQITPDPLLPYGVNDTIKALPGQSGIVNLIENDYNPGADSLILHYVYETKGARLTRVNDSTIKYYLDFSVDSPLQCYYDLNDFQNSIHAAGLIYFDIDKPSPLIDTLDVNNIRASFSAVGMHFYDPVDGNGIFEVPAGSGKSTIYQNSLWIGGKSDYALHVAAESFHRIGNDFWLGPVSESYQNDDLENYSMWKISREEIDYHITHFQDDGYIPIQSIATWPGNGNTELGQAEQLAPFFDQNEDGIYDPLDGDVPMIRGDQSLYFIFNDDYGIHYESGGLPMKIEIHGNAYAFKQPDDSALFNTIFLHYDFFNRSGNTYGDTYIGLHNYFDLGYEFDNYVQCDVGRGNAFVYNATNVDGNGQPYAYGTNPPVQGVTILGGPNMQNDNLDNPTGGCDESINGLNFDDGIVDNERLGMTKFAYHHIEGAIPPIPYEPEIAEEYYQWLTGYWNNNVQWTYGHNFQFGSGVGPECNFILPGASDPLNWGTDCEFPNGGYNQNGYYWTEETEEHQPGQRYGVSITGPFTFAPGEVQSLDVAFVYARDNDTTDQFSAIDIMNQRIDTIRNRVENGGIIYLPTYSVGISEYPQTTFAVSIFPNPASGNQIRIVTEGSSEENLHVHITDLLGRSIKQEWIMSGEIIALDISQLQNGVYILTIQDKNSMVNRKLVIRR